MTGKLPSLVAPLFSILLFGIEVLAENPPEVVIVRDVEGKNVNLTETELSTLTDYLSTLVGNYGYKVVPPERVREFITERKIKSYELRYDRDFQVELGKEFAANKVLQAQILSVGWRCKITTTLYDMLSATNDKSAIIDSECDKRSLFSEFDKIIAKLTGRESQKTEAETEKEEIIIIRRYIGFLNLDINFGSMLPVFRRNLSLDINNGYTGSVSSKFGIISDVQLFLVWGAIDFPNDKHYNAFGFSFFYYYAGISDDEYERISYLAPNFLYRFAILPFHWLELRFCIEVGIGMHVGTRFILKPPQQQSGNDMKVEFGRETTGLFVKPQLEMAFYPFKNMGFVLSFGMFLDFLGKATVDGQEIDLYLPPTVFFSLGVAL